MIDWNDFHPILDWVKENEVKQWIDQSELDSLKKESCSKCNPEPCICIHLKKFNGRRRTGTRRRRRNK